MRAIENLLLGDKETPAIRPKKCILAHCDCECKLNKQVLSTITNNLPITNNIRLKIYHLLAKTKSNPKFYQSKLDWLTAQLNEFLNQNSYLESRNLDNLNNTESISFLSYMFSKLIVSGYTTNLVYLVKWLLKLPNSTPSAVFDCLYFLVDSNCLNDILRRKNFVCADLAVLMDEAFRKNFQCENEDCKVREIEGLRERNLKLQERILEMEKEFVEYQRMMKKEMGGNFN